MGTHMKASGLDRRLRDGEPCHWRNVYDFSSSGHNPSHWSCLSRLESQRLSTSLAGAGVCSDATLSFPRDDFPPEETGEPFGATDAGLPKPEKTLPKASVDSLESPPVAGASPVASRHAKVGS